MNYDIRINEDQRKLILYCLGRVNMQHASSEEVEAVHLTIGMLQNLPAEEGKEPGALHDFTL